MELLRGKRKNNCIDWLLFFLALTSTMPIVSIMVMNRTISIFTILLPVCIIALLIRVSCIRLQYEPVQICFLAFLLLSLLCIVFGLFFFSGNKDFAGVGKSYISKVVIYILFAFLLFGINDYHMISMMAKGLLYGAILNLIWAALDGLIFYVTGVSITNTIFAYYIKANDTRMGMISLVLSRTSIRVGGFNSDPAHIGILAPFIFSYSLLCGKKHMLIYVALAILMSQSVTAVVACVLLLFLIALIKPEYLKIAIGLSITGIVLIVLLLVTPLGSFAEPIISRITAKLGPDSVESARKIYNFHFLEAAIAAPVQTLLGTGFGTASYPFIAAGLLTPDKGAFDPENTYISYLFDTGIIGMVLYIVILCYILKRTCFCIKSNQNREISMILFSGAGAIAIASFLYHYIVFATIMMSLIAGCAFIGYLGTGRGKLQTVLSGTFNENGLK